VDNCASKDCTEGDDVGTSVVTTLNYGESSVVKKLVYLVNFILEIISRHISAISSFW
jgi:hypothetical protein